MSNTIDLDIPLTAAGRLARLEENLAYNGKANYGSRTAAHLSAIVADYLALRANTIEECAEIVRAEMQRGPPSTRLGSVLDSILALSSRAV